MTKPKTSRDFESSITIDASPAEVWEAITTSQGLTRWFPLQAEVEPGKGGSISISWGPPWEGTAPITAWEPTKHFQWTEQVAMSGDDEPRPVVVDFYLERDGNRTQVRLVQSGMGTEENWDDYLESISTGWKFELQGLRHYLENHRGTSRKVVWARKKIEVRPEICANHLFRTEGSGWRGLKQQHEPGSPVRLVSSEDKPFVLEGQLLVNELPRSLVLTAENLNRALFRYEYERVGNDRELWFWLSTYNLPEKQRAQWEEHLFQLLESAVSNTSMEVR